jgi:aspartate 1-decarboxylase
MQRHMLKSKIHRATVTGCDLHYAGSITIDSELIHAADLLPGELVHVLDIDNGARFETYVIEGGRGAGDVCLNGAAARLVQQGDRVIVVSYGVYSPEELEHHAPRVVHVDERNVIVGVDHDPAALPFAVSR